MIDGLRTIGILGGMGPAATVDFMAKIVAATPARCDQEHIPVLVWSNPRIPDRTAALRDEGNPSPVSALRGGALLLEQAGADFIAIACNTAHHWHAAIQSATSLPVLHIADAAMSMIERTAPDCGTKIGLMGTEGTARSGFYARRLSEAGHAMLMPDDEGQARLGQAIADVKAGDLERARSGALTVARALLGQGADLLLFACTEIPVALRREMQELPVIDATDALAQACVMLAMAGRGLSERHGKWNIVEAL